MADVAREGNEIVLKLSTGERIMAMRRDVQFRWFSRRPAIGLFSHYLGGTAYA